MKQKLQILPPERRLFLAKTSAHVNGLSDKDKSDLINLIQAEKDGQLHSGLITYISSNVYHHPLCPGWSFSALNKAAKSAMHWLLSSDFQNEAMKIGTAFHTAILEPHLFDSEFPIGSLSNESRAVLERMISAFKAHKTYEIAFSEDIVAVNEASVFVKCPVTGLILKVRPDRLIDKRILIDLKTTGPGDDQLFEDKADSFCYEGQAAFYIDVLALVGIAISENYQWVIRRESNTISVFSYDEGFLNMGRMRYMRGLDNISKLVGRGF